MRGRQAIFLILFGLPAALTWGVHAAAAGARLSLPFACKVEGGDIRLTPAGEQSIAIVGTRQERVVLACADGRPVQCRTMIAHNFAVLCGGERVPWVRVAEAIGGRRTSRVWRDGDRLNIALRENDPKGTAASAVPCAHQQSAGAPSGAAPDNGNLMERVVLNPCKAHGARELHFVLPAGFAPVSHFGARIIDDTIVADATSGATAKVPRHPVVAAAARADAATPAVHQRLLERTILTEPLPDIDAASGPSLGPSPAPSKDTADDVLAGRELESSADTTQRLSRIGEGLRRNTIISSAVPRAAGSTATANENSQRLRTAWSVTVTPTGQDHSADLPSPATAHAPTYTSASVAPRSLSQRDVMLWLVLTSMFVTAGWMVWSRPARFATLAQRMAGGAVGGFLDKIPRLKVPSGLVSRASHALVLLLPAGRQASSSGGGFPATGLEAAYGAVSGVVDALPVDVPLRSVLDDEMRRVRQRLSLAKAACQDGQVSATAYRVLMRDLERIRRIGESARDSVRAGVGAVGAAASASGQMPRNRTEALQVLGLNTKVSDATVKKCVEALRMSWHPDLAHDAGDRVLREERTKQINVAMELISGKPRQD